MKRTAEQGAAAGGQQRVPVGVCWPPGINPGWLSGFLRRCWPHLNAHSVGRQSEALADDSKPTLRRTAFRLLQQSAGPATISAAYSAWDYFSSDEKPPLVDIIKVFAGAFFLSMWFIGQFLRARKQIQDEELLKTLHTKVDSIHEALQGAGMEPAPGAPGPVGPAPISDPVAAEMVREATEAMASGLQRSALLTAGIAYERALREFAKRSPEFEGARWKPHVILRRLSTILGEDIAGELWALWKARNILVHVSESEIATLPDPEVLLESFVSAIRFLSAQA